MKQLLLLMAMLMAGTAFAQEDADTKYAKNLLQPGTKAPALITMMNDRQLDLTKNHRGKYIVLEFWASWCRDCRADMKDMRRIHQTYCKDSIAIQGYSFDTNREAYEKVRRDSALVWDNEMCTKPMRESAAYTDYHLGWIPCYYVLDKSGTILLSTVMVEKVEAKLQEILKNQQQK